MAERIVYWNGEWIPESQAKVSIYDLSVMQGAAAFEMTRSFTRVHFKLPEHLQRLRESCRLLSIPVPDEFDQLPSILEDLSRRNEPAMRPDDEHRLLIVVSPGAAKMYAEFAGAISGSWLYAADFPLRHTVKGLGEAFTKGVRLAYAMTQQIPDAAIPAWAKHRSRLAFHRASQEMTNVWPLLCAPDGHIREAPGANLLVVRAGVVYGTYTNVLNGISQATVMHLAAEEGLSTDWTDFTTADLMDADELWLTGTPFCMLPARMDGEACPGPWYQRVLARWSKLVGVDIAAQIQRWEVEAGC